MIDRINQLSNGVTEFDVPEFNLFVSSIEETISKKSILQSTIAFQSKNHVLVKGYLYSSNPNVEVITENFSGMAGTVAYQVSTRGMAVADKIEGMFTFVYNGGELSLPYCFTVDMPMVADLKKPIKTPQEFAAFAKRDIKKATRIFRNRQFLDFPFMKDPMYVAAYEGLLKDQNEQSSLEQFLVQTKAKEAVTFSLKETKKAFQTYENPIQDDIILIRNSWGYTSFEITTDVSFITLGKTEITTDDFAGDECDIPFDIELSKLHIGMNVGKIYCKDSVSTLVCEVIVERKPKLSQNIQEIINYEKKIVDIVENYLNYREGVGSKSEALDVLYTEISDFYEMNPDDMRWLLLNAYIHYLVADYDKANELLEKAADIFKNEEEISNVDLYNFFLYIGAKNSRDEDQITMVGRLLRSSYDDSNYSLPLLLILFDLDLEIKNDPLICMESMRKVYNDGCRSPLMYGEVCKILNSHPELLKSLDSLEVQSLLYGARKDKISEKLVGIIADLAKYEKRFRYTYYQILVKMYNKYKSRNILEAICCILIRGKQTLPTAFVWYEKCVEEEIRVTSLFEYYFYSMPKHDQKPIPKFILKDFLNNHELDKENEEILYHNILRYYKNDNEVYPKFKNRIEAFAVEELKKGTVQTDMIAVYYDILKSQQIDQAIAAILPKFIFARHIVCENKAMRRVIVCYSELKREMRFVMENGSACVPVYSDKVIILFENEAGNRFAHIPFKMKPLMDVSKCNEWISCCETYYPDDILLHLRRYKQIIAKDIIGDEDVSMVLGAFRERELQPSFLIKIWQKVVQYCASRPEDNRLDDLLKAFDLTPLEKKDRAKLVDLLIDKNYFDIAYDKAKRFGYTAIDYDKLSKLATKTILDSQYARDRDLVMICYYLFSNKHYNDLILKYICKFYVGSTLDMYRMMSTAMEKKLDTSNIEERLLVQMIFTGKYDKLDPIFEYYAGKKEMDSKLLRAFCVLKSYEYFIKGESLSDEMLDYIEKEVLREKQKDLDILFLALLFDYSKRDKINADRKELAVRMINKLCAKNIYFAFYLDLQKHIELPYSLIGKTFIECKAHKKSDVWVDGVILPENSSHKIEKMQNMYSNIFVKSTILFDDEEEEYDIYAKERRVPMRYLVKGGKKKMANTFKREKTRFTEIEDVVELSGDITKLDEMNKRLKEIAVRDYMIDKFFPLI